jgi:ABC-type bacteriocin/lantibiotic exporter with double-glycine peptidase domain
MLTTLLVYTVGAAISIGAAQERSVDRPGPPDHVRVVGADFRSRADLPCGLQALLVAGAILGTIDLEDASLDVRLAEWSTEESHSLGSLRGIARQLGLRLDLLELSEDDLLRVEGPTLVPVDHASREGLQTPAHVVIAVRSRPGGKLLFLDPTASSAGDARTILAEEVFRRWSGVAASVSRKASRSDLTAVAIAVGAAAAIGWASGAMLRRAARRQPTGPT